MTPRRAAGGLVDLTLGHHAQDGIEVIDVQGEIDISTAPRLRELLIELAAKGSYQLIVNLDKAGFPGLPLRRVSPTVAAMAEAAAIAGSHQAAPMAMRRA
jgi:hypothetical protein